MGRNRCGLRPLMRSISTRLPPPIFGEFDTYTTVFGDITPTPSRPEEKDAREARVSNVSPLARRSRQGLRPTLAAAGDGTRVRENSAAPRSSAQAQPAERLRRAAVVPDRQSALRRFESPSSPTNPEALAA